MIRFSPCASLVLFFLVFCAAVARAGGAAPVYSFTFGSAGNGNGQFNQPFDVTFGPGNLLYVVDAVNHRIQRFTPDGAFVSKWGSFGSDPGEFYLPGQIAFDSQGNAYVADRLNHRVQKFTSDGVFLLQWGSLGSGPGQMNQPWGITVDAFDAVYTTEFVNDRVQKFTNQGVFLTQWGGTGSGDGQFFHPRGIDSAPDGTIYVSETLNNRVQRFTPSGSFLMKWGTTGSPKGSEEPSPPGTFTHAVGLDIDDEGFVYVADWDLHPHAGRVQKFTADGTFIWQFRGAYGSGPAQYQEIMDVAVHPSGYFYTADKLNHRIQVWESINVAAPENVEAKSWARIKSSYR
jgi:DNA-binding beta-propeller fold protein YncE